MTATKREGQWLNSVDNPYTKQYDQLRPSLSKMLNNRQKIIEIKEKRKEQADKKKSRNVPFNTHANREFTYTGNQFGPGPGSYIDVANPKNSSVLHRSASYENPHVAAMK